MIARPGFLLFSTSIGVESLFVFAQAAGSDAVFSGALNAVGLGAIAVVALYLLREQGKETREQLDKVTACFMTALEMERKQSGDNYTKVSERLGNDHQQCRLDHLSFVDKLDKIIDKQKETTDALKALPSRRSGNAAP